MFVYTPPFSFSPPKFRRGVKLADDRAALGGLGRPPLVLSWFRKAMKWSTGSSVWDLLTPAGENRVCIASANEPEASTDTPPGPGSAPDASSLPFFSAC